jgi:hypothetical protein
MMATQHPAGTFFVECAWKASVGHMHPDVWRAITASLNSMLPRNVPSMLMIYVKSIADRVDLSYDSLRVGTLASANHAQVKDFNGKPSVSFDTNSNVPSPGFGAGPITRPAPSVMMAIHAYELSA